MAADRDIAPQKENAHRSYSSGFKKLAAGLLLGAAFLLPGADYLSSEATATAVDKEDDIYEQLDLLTRILDRVRNEYVDEVDDSEVMEAAIEGMLKSLDPHSTYLNKKTFKQVRVQTEGEYGGLGIEVQMDKGVIKVVSPIDDTPAYEAGIVGGDYITHIDGTAIMGQSLTDAVTQMRGEVGTKITITVVREGLDAPFDVDIIRDKIMVRSVRHRVEEETIGYVRVTTFNMQSGKGVEDAIIDLREELGDNLEGIILDLRNNPGGLLDEAIRITDAFLDRGEIVSTRGRRRSQNQHWFARPGDFADGIPVVVLVNAASASASEIVAGALQDHRRAVLVGDRTFGKGTVQSEIRLGRQGDHAIRLTTARYYTPSGRSIQERGIEPDIFYLFPRLGNRVPRREADLANVISNDTGKLDRAGELPLEEEMEVFAEITYDDEGKPVPLPDIQLQYAISLLKGLSSLPTPQIAENTAP